MRGERLTVMFRRFIVIEDVNLVSCDVFVSCDVCVCVVDFLSWNVERAVMP